MLDNETPTQEIETDKSDVETEAIKDTETPEGEVTETATEGDEPKEGDEPEEGGAVHSITAVGTVIIPQ